jgi:predicted MFS family arabinose efflux permease
MFFVAGFAALADLAPPGRAGEALSLNSLALYVGIALGPLLGQALLRWQGFDAAWVAAVALGAVAALIATRLPETKAPDEAAEPTPLLHPAAIVPGLALFSGITAMSGFLAFAVLHARAIGVERWSVVLLLFGATVVLFRVLMAKLPDRVGPHRLAGMALALSALGLVGIGVWEVPAGLILGTLVLATGVAFLTPAVFAAVFNAVPPTERGSAAGTTSVFIDLGLGGGPMLLGVVAAATSLPASFVLVSVLPLAGTLLLAADGFRRTHVPATP